MTILLWALAAILVVVGLAGILLPALPGTVLILAAVLVWAIDQGGETAWVVFALATTLLVLGTVVKYAVPGRRLKATGVLICVVAYRDVGPTASARVTGAAVITRVSMTRAGEPAAPEATTVMVST